MHFHRLLALIEFALVACTSQTIISNHALRQDQLLYRWLFEKKRGAVIPNGIPLLNGPSQSQVSINEDKVIRILFAGRLTSIKNWDCLLEAVALLGTSLSLRLQICGEGEDRHRLMAKVHMLGIASRVDLLGYQPKLQSIMRSSDLLVLPSWSEGMSNVLFEALASGLPCIISDIPSHRELVREYNCARLFDPHSPSALAKTIEDVLVNHELRQQLRVAGIATAHQFTSETMVERHLAVYRDVLRI
jgi:glycosyltransferase involved in cell wall biosynthesis